MAEILETINMNVAGKDSGANSKIKNFFAQEFFHNSLVQWVVIGTFILNLADWVALTYFIRPTDLPIILHYNVYFGVDVIGDWWQVYILPSMGVFFFFINSLLAYFLYHQKKERVASYLFLLTSFIVQSGIIIASIGIIDINY